MFLMQLYIVQYMFAARVHGVAPIGLLVLYISNVYPVHSAVTNVRM